MGPSGALLAIDAGSSRTRVTLLTDTGETLASAAAATPSTVDNGAAVLSGECLWRQIIELVRQLRPGDVAVTGIGIAAQLGVALVDEAGHPVDDVILWPDGRAGREAAALRGALVGFDGVLGRRVTAEMPASKLMWWAANRPAVLDSARWALSVKDFIVMRLTGVAVTDETHASYSGWFDVGTRGYSADLVRRSGVPPALLPPVRGATEAAGTLTATAARDLGLAEGISVAVGAPDGAVGALGAGAVHSGVTVDVAGTTDVVLSVTDEPRWSEGGGVLLNAYLTRDRWVIGGPTGMTGGAVDWVARLLGYGSGAEAFDRLGEQALAIALGCEGLSLSPALTGSRLPHWNSDERGILAGLAPHHGPAHVLRAALEGAAFVVLEAIDAVRAAGADVEEITVAGGVAKQPALVRLRSTVWDMPVRVIAGQEATTIGAAMLAGLSGGVFIDPAHAAEALVAPGQVVRPEPVNRAAVARARHRWQAAVAQARAMATLV